MNLEQLVKKFISEAGPIVGATGVDVPDDYRSERAVR